MIEVVGLKKNYGETQALKGVDLTIPNGKIFGFLGHNGAGKSTIIKSLVSIIEPTEGKIYFDGEELINNRLDIKKSIGYVPDTPDMFLQLTAEEYWDLVAAAYEIPKDVRQQRQEELLALFEMTGKESDTLEGFSHGMRQKAIVIGALLSDPDIWILDEPLQGLDPQAAFDLKELMKKHAENGKTVIFSTHILSTAEQLCDELAILKKGELIYNGSVKDLLASAENESLEKIYLKMTGKHSNGELIEELEEMEDE
ncbi:ABC transporter ATP-binding protein [Vagococcus elongatus]|uniref:3-dehydroquinate dehydratase n=1 Tax=Vagococcus elongatus TaxID=180344 RepID=A0A430B5J3_9ENTE|nr:ABC transporter ATP-binding protein [Vagococcus elongatus]RSU15547.1 3-dehydroquinate dehydratase [Vagococcus elongatus]